MRGVGVKEGDKEGDEEGGWDDKKRNFTPQYTVSVHRILPGVPHSV